MKEIKIKLFDKLNYKLYIVAHLDLTNRLNNSLRTIIKTKLKDDFDLREELSRIM